jgi:alkaline phosphatase D
MNRLRACLGWLTFSCGVPWIFILLAPVVTVSAQDSIKGPFFGNCTKVGEVSSSDAILWIRLTEAPEPNFSGHPYLTNPDHAAANSVLLMPDDILPGMKGEVQVQYWEISQPDETIASDWFKVDPEKDFTAQYILRSLQPGTEYGYKVTSRTHPQSKGHSTAGYFSTAPNAASEKPARFIVSTCQAITSVDSEIQGHVAYRIMEYCRPNFFVHTGDFVYYDKPPLAKTVAQARAKWNTMFAYGHLRQFLSSVSTYFMKDDHDTLKDDCWPGQSYGDLTFDEGKAIFREQVPMGELTYRTYRWGKHLQIWLTENRDYRTPNREQDGPEKTILGAKQKTWLKDTITASEATFKIVISPDPIVGPDKLGKKDNHANKTFATEGAELRKYLSDVPNTYVICGDRHWQYCSKDVQTGLIEFGCGPINDMHDFGGNPGYDPEMHLYFDGGGGFLLMEVTAEELIARWYGVSTPDKNAVPEVRKEMRFPVLNPR